jgi:hypothetical protein
VNNIADAFVADRIAQGADYLKVIVEDGHVLGNSVPVLDEAVLAAMVRAGMFVIPTLTTLASITGQGAGTALARNPLVRARVPAPWLDNLAGNWATQPPKLRV